jgi:hypothetical protein
VAMGPQSSGYGGGREWKGLTVAMGPSLAAMAAIGSGRALRSPQRINGGLRQSHADEKQFHGGRRPAPGRLHAAPGPA